MNIDDQLGALKAAERQVEPPAGLESQVLAAFDAQTLRTAPHGGRRMMATGLASRQWLAGAALAAGVLLGVSGTVAYLRRAEPPVIPAEAVGESVVFVLDPPAVEETVRVVRIRVARSALENLGIHTVAAQDGDTALGDTALGDTVEVDVLVGEDGVARGVRLAM